MTRRVRISSEPGKLLECLKFGFDTMREAEEAARKARERSSQAIGAYACTFSEHEGKFHIGHVRRGKSPTGKKRHRRKRK